MAPVVQACRTHNSLIDAAQHCISNYLHQGGDLSFKVKGSCMAPIICDGEQITIRRKAHYYSGDVMAYYCPHKKSYILHRLLGAIPRQDGRQYVLKADHGLRPDALVEQQNILGCAIDVPVKYWLRPLYFSQFIYWLAALTVKKVSNGLV